MDIQGTLPGKFIQIKQAGRGHLNTKPSHSSALPPVPGNSKRCRCSCSCRAAVLLLLLVLHPKGQPHCRLLVLLLKLLPQHLLLPLPHCLRVQGMCYIYNTTILRH